LLLRKKAAEELKKEQERKAAERRRIIEERCGKPKNIDDASEGNVFAILYYLSAFFYLFDKFLMIMMMMMNLISLKYFHYLVVHTFSEKQLLEMKIKLSIFLYVTGPLKTKTLQIYRHS
jgi:Troponin